MKNRTGTFTLLLALVLAGGGNAFAAEDSTAPDAAAARCSEATLHGTYLFANDGLIVSGIDQARSPMLAWKCMTATAIYVPSTR